MSDKAAKKSAWESLCTDEIAKLAIEFPIRDDFDRASWKALLSKYQSIRDEIKGIYAPIGADLKKAHEDAITKGKEKRKELLNQFNEAKVLADNGRFAEARKALDAAKERLETEKKISAREIESVKKWWGNNILLSSIADNYFCELFRRLIHEFRLKYQHREAEKKRLLCDKLSDALASKVQQNANSTPNLTPANVPAPAEAQAIYSPPMNMRAIAAIFDQSESTMRRWLNAKQIKAKRAGKKWRIAIDELPPTESDNSGEFAPSPGKLGQTRSNPVKHGQR